MLPLACMAVGVRLIFNKYKTFSVLIYSHINTRGYWKNEKLCGNMTPVGRRDFTQFRVFPISTNVDITVHQYGKMFYFFNITQRNIKKEISELTSSYINTALANQRSEFTNAKL